MIKKILQFMGGAFLLLLMVSCFASDTEPTVGTSSDSKQEISEVNEVEAPDFEFVEGPTLVEREYGMKYIEGILKNNTGEDIKNYIDMSFTLYDADGNMVGTAYANGNVLKDGGTWKFEAIVLEENVVDFELDNINSF